jgi:transcriptional/translational regulatory protein YebC/TACO1
MEAGAENYEANGDNFTVTTEAHDLMSVRDQLEKLGVTVISADLALVPQNTIPVTEQAEANKILRLMDAIDDHDDVQNVFSNFDISDELLAAFEG